MDTPEMTTLEIIEQFNAAFNLHDVDAIMDIMTEDCVFGDTYPPPDGRLFQGHQAVRAYWDRFFQESPQALFTFFDLFACGERAVVRWNYRWVDTAGVEGHIQGVDVLRVRAGRVAEKFSYVKG
jgi:ketosteroid isomerase-like protein